MLRPAWPTVYGRFAQWSKARVWARLRLRPPASTAP
ncbi:hypothetical protein [Streptomyces sp. NPDC126933]